MRRLGVIAIGLSVLGCTDESSEGLDAGGINRADVGPRVDGGVPVGGEWQSLAPMPAGPRQETAVVAIGGEIFVLGGLDPVWTDLDRVEAYDPATDSWRDVTPLPVAMHHANAAAVGGRIYVLGFLTGRGFTADGRVFSFDPASGAGWTEEMSMPAGKQRGAAGVAVVGGRIHIVGGYRGGAKSEHSVFDTASKTWEALPDLPRASEHLVAGSIGDDVFAVGGRNPTPRGTVDAFDVAAELWSTAPPMSKGRAGFAGSAVVEGRLYAFGGEGNLASPSGVFADVEVFEPSTGWASLAPMPRPKHGTQAAELDGKIYIPAGAYRQGLSETTAELDVFIPPQ